MSALWWSGVLEGASQDAERAAKRAHAAKLMGVGLVLLKGLFGMMA